VDLLGELRGPIEAAPTGVVYYQAEAVRRTVG